MNHYPCFGQSICENGAHGLQDNAPCPQTSICLCPKCFERYIDGVGVEVEVGFLKPEQIGSRFGVLHSRSSRSSVCTGRGKTMLRWCKTFKHLPVYISCHFLTYEVSIWKFPGQHRVLPLVFYNKSQKLIVETGQKERKLEQIIYFF
jgi:hypothetical protein